jgi:hypothetical protein
VCIEEIAEAPKSHPNKGYLGQLMRKTQFTRVEVILLVWQPLPDELLNLCADWMFTESRFFRIAQADILDGLSIRLIGLFEHLKQQNRITDFCSRVVMSKQIVSNTSPDTEPLMMGELPDWVRPEIQLVE